jgi:hypothetical protein
MKYNLFFLISSVVIVALSIITIITAPIINGILGQNWGTENCQKYSDNYDYYKKNNEPQTKIDNENKELKKCNRNKAMHDLEYASFIFDIVISFFCSILSFLHFFNVGKFCEKINGIIGFASGIIGFLLTIIYIIYSAYIFSNDNNQTDRLFENSAYMKWDGSKYIYTYTKEEYDKDPNVVYAKYKDLGKKQYNYNSDLYKQSQDTNSEFYNCHQFNIALNSYHTDFSSYQLPKSYTNGNSEVCQYLWEADGANIEIKYKDSANKYLYDRWLTTIILGVFIALFDIALSLFGILLVMNESNDLKSSSNNVLIAYSNNNN